MCTQAFSQLKDKLTQAPILAFPADAPPFLPASAVGVGSREVVLLHTPVAH